MPIGIPALKGASRLLLCAGVALLALSAFSQADARPSHRRATSIYGAAPAYWSAGRPADTRRDALGRRVLRLHRADAGVVQLDPHLRGSDGRLAEHIEAVPPSGPPLPPELYIAPFNTGVPTFVYWRGYWRYRHAHYQRRR
jgi:hypothetical protein